MSHSIDLPRRNDTTVSIFNPLEKDFTTDMRNDDNVVEQKTIPSMEIATFPHFIAERMKKDLKTMIKNERGIDPNDETKDKEIDEEITVNESK